MVGNLCSVRNNREYIPRLVWCFGLPTVRSIPWPRPAVFVFPGSLSFCLLWPWCWETTSSWHYQDLSALLLSRLCRIVVEGRTPWTEASPIALASIVFLLSVLLVPTRILSSHGPGLEYFSRYVYAVSHGSHHGLELAAYTRVSLVSRENILWTPTLVWVTTFLIEDKVEERHK